MVEVLGRQITASIPKVLDQFHACRIFPVIWNSPASFFSPLGNQISHRRELETPAPDIPRADLRQPPPIIPY